MPEPLSADVQAGDAPAPFPEALLALAPLRLRNYRQVRYIGDDLCIRLVDLAGRDQELLRGIYGTLTELLLLISDESADDRQRWEEVGQWAERHDPDALVDDVRELGHASRPQHDNEQFAKSMHDVRGGALSALLGRLQLLDHLPRDEANLQALFVLARDQHKIMRSAVLGLDDRRRAADHLPKAHDVRLVLQKWHESVVGPKWRERPVRLFVDCHHEGALTECCLESAALDRIFYNLANNACRHCTGERLEMAIFPVPLAPGECLRFVLSNPVSATDAAFLRGTIQAGGGDSADKGLSLNLESLFYPNVSSTGSGFGLTVVADFVAGAFGLADRRQALHERYVGAVLDGDTFRVWFHWPVADNHLPQKLDDYHRPKESLSEADPSPQVDRPKTS